MKEFNYSDRVDLTIPKMKLEISKAIAKELKDNKYSLREFAKKVNMSHPQIIRITSGKNYNIDTLLKVLDGLNLEIVVKRKFKK